MQKNLHTFLIIINNKIVYNVHIFLISHSWLLNVNKHVNLKKYNLATEIDFVINQTKRSKLINLSNNKYYMECFQSTEAFLCVLKMKLFGNLS